MAQEKPETVVYVSNCGDPSISVLAFDRAKGDVELIEKIDIPGAEAPSPTSMPLALSPGPAVSVRRAAQRAVHDCRLHDRSGRAAG